jgi:hypothetical protein
MQQIAAPARKLAEDAAEVLQAALGPNYIVNAQRLASDPYVVVVLGKEPLDFAYEPHNARRRAKGEVSAPSVTSRAVAVHYYMRKGRRLAHADSREPVLTASEGELLTYARMYQGK